MADSPLGRGEGLEALGVGCDRRRPTLAAPPPPQGGFSRRFLPKKSMAFQVFAAGSRFRGKANENRRKCHAAETGNMS